MDRDASRKWEQDTSRRKAGVGTEEGSHSGAAGGLLWGAQVTEIQVPVMSREEAEGRREGRVPHVCLFSPFS